MKFSIKDFFSKYPPFPHLVKKSLTEIFIFCVVYLFYVYNNEIT